MGAREKGEKKKHNLIKKGGGEWRQGKKGKNKNKFNKDR